MSSAFILIGVDFSFLNWSKRSIMSPSIDFGLLGSEMLLNEFGIKLIQILEILIESISQSRELINSI